MIYLIFGYVYLMIHRPMEIWPALEPLRPELLYFTILCAAWLIAWKRVVPDLNQLAIGMMGLVTYLSWMVSPWHDYGDIAVKNYTLVFVFALILSTVLRDEQAVHRVIVAFLTVMTLYMLHSIWEFRNGRHVFRMGIVRLIGIDQSLNDPNSFGASIVYALPFVRYLWVAWGPGWKHKLLVAYALLSAVCIGLTGSRSSLLGLFVYLGLTVLLTSRKKIIWLGLAPLVCLCGLMLLPSELQTRFYTIIDPSVGPANAQESGQGRIMGFFIGIKLWQQNPVLGIGPGAWRPASGMPIESHSLYGQMLGELGTLGTAAFGLLLFSITRRLRTLFRNLNRDYQLPKQEPLYHLAQAIAVSTLLLLVMGLFGHNLYRYNYVWYAAFSSVLVRSYRIRPVEYEAGNWYPGWAGTWA
jgi:O-antigen ligase